MNEEVTGMTPRLVLVSVGNLPPAESFVAVTLFPIVVWL